MNRKISFRQRKVERLFSKIFRRRRKQHLESRVFRAQHRVKDLLNTRQKIILVLVVVIAGGLVGLTNFSSFLNVEKVSIARSSLDLPLSEIELSVRDLAFGKNILSVDKDLIQRAIMEMRPDIAKVEVRKKLPNEIQVEVFKLPIVAELRINDEKIFLNEKGFEVAGDSPDHDALQIVLAEEREEPTEDDPFVTPEHLAYIKEAVFYFEALTDLQVLNVKYFPIAREVHLKTEHNFDLWLELDGDYRTQLNKLVEAADLLQINTTKYEYIDLRVREKIFYKTK